MNSAVRSFVLGLLMFSALCHSVEASDDVRCVQQGLLILGYDPSGVDGLMGRGTESAAADYLQAHPDTDLPVLSAETVTDWCNGLLASSGDRPSRIPLASLQGVGINSAVLWSGSSEQDPRSEESFIRHFAPLQSFGFSHVVLVSCIDWIVDLECKKGFQNREGIIDAVRLLLDNTNLHVTLSFKPYEQSKIDGLDVSTFQSRLKSEDSVQDLFVAAWADMASVFNDVPRERLSFNILNEPEFRDPLPTPALRQEWEGLASRTIQAIRAVSSDRVIIVEGVDRSKFNQRRGQNDPSYRDSSPDRLIQPLPFEDIIYGFHSYEPRTFLDQSMNRVGFIGRPYSEQHRNMVNDDANRAIDWANRHNVPVMITETGCVGYIDAFEGPAGPDECGRYAADVYDLFVQRDIPIVWWGLEKERTIYVKQRSDCQEYAETHCDLWMPAVLEPDRFLFEGLHLTLP